VFSFGHPEAFRAYLCTGMRGPIGASVRSQTNRDPRPPRIVMKAAKEVTNLLAETCGGRVVGGSSLSAIAGHINRGDLEDREFMAKCRFPSATFCFTATVLSMAAHLLTGGGPYPLCPGQVTIL
jgi:hypothetical protein